MVHDLDVRDLPPPEPFERTVASLAALAPGDVLRVHIHRRPRLLYERLDAEGLAHTTRELPDGTFEVCITVPA
jgi:uncharacterized protein (DUF2249 family)